MSSYWDALERALSEAVDAEDATADDIERWAAARGCIIANAREIPANTLVEYEGKTIQPSDDCHIWTADIVISEGIEG